MKCPSCGATVEDGADLCLECGEPMGESPAAKVARAENVIRPPADAFTPAPVPRQLPTSGRPAPPLTPPPRTTTPQPSLTPPPRTTAPPPGGGTARATPKRPLRVEEPEPRRCPGCGTRSFATRCPGCGTRLRSDDE